MKRITPACAGKSLAVPRCVVFCRDHPRVRGEKVSVLPMMAHCPGSPPRARGKAPNPTG